MEKRRALYLVTSPFQVMCSFETIKQFQIEEPYYIIVSKEANERDWQIAYMLRDKGYNFEKYQHVESNNRIVRIIRSYINPFLDRKCIYDYLFIGDYRHIHEFIRSYHNLLKKSADIIYFDDGASTITIFRGLYKENFKARIIRLYYKFISLLYNIGIGKYYTIFYNLPCSAFDVIPNKLTYLKCSDMVPNDKVFFIGTNTIGYCIYHQFSHTQFLKEQYAVFVRLKSILGDRDIVMFPHGRDNSIDYSVLSEEVGVEIKRPDSCIEYYFYREKIIPNVVVGFGSTALFTIKSMYPSSLVINLFWGSNDENSRKNYEEIIKLYSQIGIITCGSLEELTKILQKNLKYEN